MSEQLKLPSPREPARPLPWAPIIVVTVLALTALASFVSPWFAFQAVRSAAEAGDRSGLDAVVDYSSVRGSLRPQVRARIPDRPPERVAGPQPERRRPNWLPDFIPLPRLDSSPLAPLTRPFDRERAVAREVDRLTSPEGLADLASGRAHVRDWGIKRFRVAVRDGEPPRETTFTLERGGMFEWKLVHVGLPPRPQAPAPNP